MERKMAEQKKSGRHSPLIFVVAFSLALIAIPSVTRALAQVAALKPSSATELPEVRIISTEFSFTPAQVRVAAGRELTLVLDNHLGETEHKFVLPALGFHLEARAGEITRKNILITKPGAYDFTCDLPGHRDAGMQGMLIAVDQ
jgi:uncharacterized cupredoxin-like copper-binding protein